jgi:NAD(P)-dependent dehydrogenase (short-subunit alcohol dehydrogenase family)
MTNPLDFTGKVALVTGAAAGMGLATARAFAQAGATVVLADVSERSVRAEADTLVEAGHRALAIRCDVSDDAEVAARVERTVAEFGRLDAAFNNAGVMARITPVADSSRDEWDRVIGINLRGVWSCMKHELRQMERQGSGVFINAIGRMDAVITHYTRDDAYGGYLGYSWKSHGT